MLHQSLNISPEEFLRPFFEPGEKICLRVFDDKKRGIFKGMKLETTLEQLGSMAGALRDHNAQMRGVYFVVNSGGHEDSDITRINAQFMECDDLSLEEQYARIAAFPLEPSIIVRTRKSLHTYWLTRGADAQQFRGIQKRLAQHFGGDKACVNESRVLRLPGFDHCKDAPIPVVCVKFNPELRYTQAQLEAVLPTLADETSPVNTPQPAKGTRLGLGMVLRNCLFLQHCRNNASTLPEHDWYAMITNLAVFDGGEAHIHALSQDYPGYQPGETQEKISHFMASGTKPITCRTIAEKGYRCPHLLDGSCPCKAPAALCYQPPSVEDLRAMLSEQPVTDDQMQNIQAAQRFVREALYNTDPVVARAFIDHEVKRHFSLSAQDVRPLAALQRDTCAAHQKNHDTKREAMAEELPEWYEPTERGGLRFLPGVLADHMAAQVDAFYGAGSFFGYECGVYVASEDLWAQAKVREFMLPRQATMSAIADALGQWKVLMRKPVREINCNPYIVNVRNGLYNVLDGSFKPHTPAYFSTVQISADYDESAGCPQFHAFLNSVLKEPEIRLIQEILGYLLLPVNKAQKSFVFVGAPNAGKSTLLSVVQEILLGNANVSNIPWQGLGDRFNKAELFGKLANIFADLPSKAIDDNGMFKALTGDDFIIAERKNKDPFSFRCYARFLFSCNEIPRNYGDRSEGFYRRLLIIRFHRSVPAGERDPFLLEKLTAERDGILLWALDGLRRLIAQNYLFSETDATKAELQQYRVESNSALSFVEEYCEVGLGRWALRDELFNRYREYCNQAGFKPMSQTSFNKELETVHQVKRSRDKVSKRRAWEGISFCEEGKDEI